MQEQAYVNTVICLCSAGLQQWGYPTPGLLMVRSTSKLGPSLDHIYFLQKHVHHNGAFYEKPSWLSAADVSWFNYFT